MLTLIFNAFQFFLFVIWSHLKNINVSLLRNEKFLSVIASVVLLCLQDIFGYFHMSGIFWGSLHANSCFSFYLKC